MEIKLDTMIVSARPRLEKTIGPSFDHPSWRRSRAHISPVEGPF